MSILNIMKMPEFISWCHEWENNKQCHLAMVDWFLDFGTKECDFYADVCRWCLCKRTYYLGGSNRIINNEDWQTRFSGFIRPTRFGKSAYLSWYKRPEAEAEQLHESWDCNDIHELIAPKFPGIIRYDEEDKWKDYLPQSFHLLSQLLMIPIMGTQSSTFHFPLFENAIAWLLGTWYESKVEPRSLLSEEEQSLIIW